MPLQQDPFSNIVSVSWPDGGEDDTDDGTGEGGGPLPPTHWKANYWFPSTHGVWIWFATFTSGPAAEEYINSLIALPLEIGGGGIFLGYEPPLSGLWDVANTLAHTFDEEHPNGYGYNPFTGNHNFYMINPTRL